MLPTTALSVANKSIHCCQQKLSMLPTKAFNVGNNSFQCCQQQLSMFPTKAFNVANNSFQCCQQKLSLFPTKAFIVDNKSFERCQEFKSEPSKRLLYVAFILLQTILTISAKSLQRERLHQTFNTVHRAHSCRDVFGNVYFRCRRDIK